MLYRERNTADSEILTKQRKLEFMNVKPGGILIKHNAIKG